MACPSEPTLHTARELHLAIANRVCASFTLDFDPISQYRAIFSFTFTFDVTSARI